MPPAALTSKGTGTLARKWRKIKKRCSSFSSSDNMVNGNRSAKDNEDDEGIDDVDHVNANDGSKLANLRDKISQWSSDRRRRNSQGNNE